MRHRPISILAASLLLTLTGCHGVHRAASTRPSTSLVGLTAPTPTASVEAIASPPARWTPQPLETGSNYTQQVWLSPTGSTAYGVIHIHLPLPVGRNLTLNAFLEHMRQREGEANLISRQDAPDLPGLRFVAEGGRYRIRVNLIVHGWNAWAVFAGTLRARPVNEDELLLAERAREATLPGMPETAHGD